jgi:hypothetical protein
MSTEIPESDTLRTHEYGVTLRTYLVTPISQEVYGSSKFEVYGLAGEEASKKFFLDDLKERVNKLTLKDIAVEVMDVPWITYLNDDNNFPGRKVND